MITAQTTVIGTAVLAAIRTVVLCGDGVGPQLWSSTNLSGPGWQGIPGQGDFIPYAVLYDLPGNTFDGSLQDPDRDVWWSCQITIVGVSRAQVTHVADLIRNVMQPQNLTLSVGFVNRCEPVGGGGVRRDDTEQPPVMILPEIYRLNVMSTL